MRWSVLISLVLASVLVSAEQPQTPEQSFATLKSIIDPLTRVSGELEGLRNELNDAASDEAKLEIQARIDTESERVRQLRGNFRAILGGAEAAEYDGAATGGITIQEQVSELVQPVLGQLRKATASPRELEELRAYLATWEDRKKKAGIIVSRIDELTVANKDPSLISELESARRYWEGKEAESTSQIGVVSAQIEDRESHKETLWEKLSSVFRRFFRSSGVNLLLAALTGIFGFVVTRRIYLWLRRFSPVHRKGKGSLMSRASDILAFAVAVLVAIFGVVLVFYARGDWFLLTLVVILLIGAAWAGKTGLSPYLEQVRMILNLGSVREGERVVHLGLPWNVQSIGFFTTFTNPNLQGGALRIPIRDLTSMTSRDPDPKEPWFPTKQDDWVVLADDTYGKVLTQTPEQIVVLRLGGSLKTYSTVGFLEQTPENLSRGFRITCTFGVDYGHQAESTSEIPKILADAITSALVADFGREEVHSVKVEFSSAAASSLDYEILADFDGVLAHRYNFIRRKIQRLCVDTCNTHGWIIPFTQITVHQADQSAE